MEEKKQKKKNKNVCGFFKILLAVGTVVSLLFGSQKK